MCCLKRNGHRDTLTQKKAGFLCSGLNAGSFFISQDEGLSESPVEMLEKALRPCLKWPGGLISFDTSRGTQSSVHQKVTMPGSC